MFILLIISTLIFSIFTGLPNLTAQFSSQLQSICISSVNSEIRHNELLGAFICGKSLSPGTIRDLWTTTGLYHLLVVSGSHLIALISCWDFLTLSAKAALPKSNTSFEPAFTVLEALLLLAFSLMTGFQAPLVRSLLGKLLNHLSQTYKWGWPSDIIVMSSGVSCLLLFPDWISSRSLILSWMASLALTQGRGLLQKAVYVFAFVLPCLWGWGQLNPITILVNVILAPVQGVVLLISCLLSWISPLAAQAGLELSIAILKATSEVTPRSEISAPLDTWLVWAFLIAMTCILHFQRVHNRRDSCSFSS
jgi:predicted membrane metal-binding protein